MARSCSVCRDKRINEINIACQEGVGTQQIAQDYGHSRAAIDSHRTSGHAARALTKAILDAHKGPLSEYAQIFIASKLNRMTILDELLVMATDALRSQKERGVDQVDAKLMKEARSLLETAEKMTGEWRPDGGEKAEANKLLAQSIVIHALATANVMESTQPITIDAKLEE